ncbi:unnamed protein product [Amoebophrya sp. A120]|nr:unnamed protein product [Amoebophrya sp. A120]|eukprot:GSA120T00025564001.1
MVGTTTTISAQPGDGNKESIEVKSANKRAPPSVSKKVKNKKKIKWEQHNMKMNKDNEASEASAAPGTTSNSAGPAAPSSSASSSEDVVSSSEDFHFVGVQPTATTIAAADQQHQHEEVKNDQTSRADHNSFRPPMSNQLHQDVVDDGTTKSGIYWTVSVGLILLPLFLYGVILFGVNMQRSAVQSHGTDVNVRGKPMNTGFLAASSPTERKFLAPTKSTATTIEKKKGYVVLEDHWRTTGKGEAARAVAHDDHHVVLPRQKEQKPVSSDGKSAPGGAGHHAGPDHGTGRGAEEDDSESEDVAKEDHASSKHSDHDDERDDHVVVHPPRPSASKMKTTKTTPTISQIPGPAPGSGPAPAASAAVEIAALSEDGGQQDEDRGNSNSPQPSPGENEMKAASTFLEEEEGSDESESVSEASTAVDDGAGDEDLIMDDYTTGKMNSKSSAAPVETEEFEDENQNDQPVGGEMQMQDKHGAVSRSSSSDVAFTMDFLEVGQGTAAVPPRPVQAGVPSRFVVPGSPPVYPAVTAHVPPGETPPGQEPSLHHHTPPPSAPSEKEQKSRLKVKVTEKDLQQHAPLQVVYYCKYRDGETDTIADRAARPKNAEAPQAETVEDYLNKGRSAMSPRASKEECMRKCTGYLKCGVFASVPLPQPDDSGSTVMCFFGDKTHANTLDADAAGWEISCVAASGTGEGSGLTEANLRSLAGEGGDSSRTSGRNAMSDADRSTVASEQDLEGDDDLDALDEADEYEEDAGAHAPLVKTPEENQTDAQHTSSAVAGAVERHDTCRGSHWWSRSHCECLMYDAGDSQGFVPVNVAEGNKHGRETTMCDRDAKIGSVCGTGMKRNKEAGEGRCVFKCASRHCKCIKHGDHTEYKDGNANCKNKWDGRYCGSKGVDATCRAKPPLGGNEICVKMLNAVDSVNPFAAIPPPNLNVLDPVKRSVQGAVVGQEMGQDAQDEFLQLAALDSTQLVKIAGQKSGQELYFDDALNRVQHAVNIGYLQRLQNYLYVPLRGWIIAEGFLPPKLVQVLNLAVEGAMTYIAVVAYGSVPAIAIPLAIFRAAEFYCSSQEEEKASTEEGEDAAVKKSGGLSRKSFCKLLNTAKNKFPGTTHAVYGVMNALNFLLTGSNLVGAAKEFFHFAHETFLNWETVRNVIGDERAKQAEAVLAAAAAAKSVAYLEVKLLRACGYEVFRSGAKKLAGALAEEFSWGDCLERSTKEIIDPETGALVDAKGLRARLKGRGKEIREKFKGGCKLLGHGIHKLFHWKSHDEEAAGAAAAEEVDEGPNFDILQRNAKESIKPAS